MMQGLDEIIRSLEEAGCIKEEAWQIAASDSAGDGREALRRLRRVRGRLLDDLHESQRRLDRIDILIREQERQTDERSNQI